MHVSRSGKKLLSTELSNSHSLELVATVLIHQANLESQSCCSGTVTYKDFTFPFGICCGLSTHNTLTVTLTLLTGKGQVVDLTKWYGRDIKLLFGNISLAVFSLESYLDESISPHTWRWSGFLISLYISGRDNLMFTLLSLRSLSKYLHLDMWVYTWSEE